MHVLAGAQVFANTWYAGSRAGWYATLPLLTAVEIPRRLPAAAAAWQEGHPDAGIGLSLAFSTSPKETTHTLNVGDCL